MYGGMRGNIGGDAAAMHDVAGQVVARNRPGLAQREVVPHSCSCVPLHTHAGKHCALMRILRELQRGPGTHTLVGKSPAGDSKATGMTEFSLTLALVIERFPTSLSALLISLVVVPGGRPLSAFHRRAHFGVFFVASK